MKSLSQKDLQIFAQPYLTGEKKEGLILTRGQAIVDLLADIATPSTFLVLTKYILKAEHPHPNLVDRFMVKLIQNYAPLPQVKAEAFILHNAQYFDHFL